MHIFISVLAIIICLICVLGIHELGHALAARLFQVKIKSVSIGFGRTLAQWPMKNGATLAWCLWPLGGRVHLLNSRIDAVTPEQALACFDKKNWWQRCVILLAGSLANFIAAILALSLMLVLGYKQISPIISSVANNSPAAIAGLKADDNITQVAGHPTAYWRDVSMQFIMHVGQDKVSVTACNSTNQCRQTQLDLRLWHGKEDRFSMFNAIGIKPNTTPIRMVKGLPLERAITEAFHQSVDLIIFLLIILKQILTGTIPFSALLGPFKLFQTIIDSFMQGFATFLYFIANFSLAMALVNILPIPSLDGGSIIYCLIEKIRGKPVSVAWELLIHRLLFIVFALIFVQLILNDLRYYFGIS